MLEAKKVHSQKSGMTVSNIMYEEQGDKIWTSKDGVKRQAILDAVGLEYKQLNLLASALSAVIEILATDYPQILTDDRVTIPLSKFAEIEAIRNS